VGLETATYYDNVIVHWPNVYGNRRSRWL